MDETAGGGTRTPCASPSGPLPFPQAATRGRAGRGASAGPGSCAADRDRGWARGLALRAGGADLASRPVILLFPRSLRGWRLGGAAASGSAHTCSLVHTCVGSHTRVHKHMCRLVHAPCRLSHSLVCTHTLSSSSRSPFSSLTKKLMEHTILSFFPAFGTHLFKTAWVQLVGGPLPCSMWDPPLTSQPLFGRCAGERRTGLRHQGPVSSELRPSLPRGDLPGLRPPSRRPGVTLRPS